MSFCRSCSTKLNDKAIFCINCGLKPNDGNKFCQSCGKQTKSKAVICIKCGVSLKKTDNIKEEFEQFISKCFPKNNKD